MTREELLDRLNKLSKAALEELIFRLEQHGIQPSHLPPCSAPHAERVVALLRAAEAQGLMEDVARRVARPVTSPQPARSAQRVWALVGGMSLTVVLGFLAWWLWPRPKTPAVPSPPPPVQAQRDPAQKPTVKDPTPPPLPSRPAEPSSTVQFQGRIENLTFIDKPRAPVVIHQGGADPKPRTSGR